MVDSNASSVVLSAAWVSIKDIEFEAEETADANEVDGEEIEFAGPYFVDLLSTSPLPFDTDLIAEAAYKRIKMKFHASSSALPTGVPAQLAGNSIYLAGTVGANNFTFQLDDSTEINVGGANSITPTEGSSLLVEVNLANVFKQISLASVTNNEIIDKTNRHAGINLCPSIDPSSNDLYTCLRKGLEKHCDFGKDENGDDDLGSTEDVK